MSLTQRQVWLLDRVSLQAVLANPNTPPDKKQQAKVALDNLEALLVVDGAMKKKQGLGAPGESGESPAGVPEEQMAQQQAISESSSNS